MNLLWLGLLVAVVGCAEQVVVSSEERDVVAPTCITIQRGISGQVADTYVKKNARNKSFGDKATLRVSDKEEALLRFDFDAIPGGAKIKSAKLKLYVNGENSDGSIEVHRVNASWAENTVTYSGFDQQFRRHVVARFRAESAIALETIDVTSLVRNWNAGQPNYGFLLHPGEDHRPRCADSDDDDADPTLFVSSESANTKRRPALEVCYTLPPAPCTDCEPQDDECSAGSTDPDCVDSVNYCATQPCRNGGTCTSGASGFSCGCASGFTGATCDQRIGGCADAPCHNGATCTDSANGYACVCASGFAGPTCDTNIDDCIASACLDGGTCVDELNSYTCSCVPDRGGAHCEIDLNSCAQQPCLNGGTCTNTQGGYTCGCAAGYGGVNCDINIDDCSPTACQNGGLCIDGIASHTCSCPPGFVGATCEPGTRVFFNVPFSGAVVQYVLRKVSSPADPGVVGTAVSDAQGTIDVGLFPEGTYQLAATVSYQITSPGECTRSSQFEIDSRTNLMVVGMSWETCPAPLRVQPIFPAGIPHDGGSGTVTLSCPNVGLHAQQSLVPFGASPIFEIVEASQCSLTVVASWQAGGLSCSGGLPLLLVSPGAGVSGEISVPMSCQQL